MSNKYKNITQNARIFGQIFPKQLQCKNYFDTIKLYLNFGGNFMIDIKKVMSELTLEEKAGLCSGQTF